MSKIDKQMKTIEKRLPIYNIVTDFGATLDTSDPLVVAKNTTALQAAIAQVLLVGGGTVFIPSGKFVYDYFEVVNNDSSAHKEVHLTLLVERGSILADFGARHNYFTNTKFEHSEVNNSGQSSAMAECQLFGNP